MPGGEDDGRAHWRGGVHQLGVASLAAQGPWWASASVGASSCFGLRVIIFEDSDVQACSPD